MGLAVVVVIAMVDAESAVEDEAAADFSGVDGLNADEEEAVAAADEDGVDEEEEDESTPVAVTMAPNSVLVCDANAEAEAEEEYVGFNADDDADAACVVRCPASAAAIGNSEAASARPPGLCARKNHEYNHILDSLNQEKV